MFGFLNVYKPRGVTSHDVVARVRRAIGIRQVGHTGTLDPFAEGVLPICVGKATRLIEYLEDDKAYEGVVKFGAATTTFDLEGEIVKTSLNRVPKEQLETALCAFRGKIEQRPPVYSAIKINGKKLYEYARNGEEIEVPMRTVEIFKLELLEFNEEQQQARLYIECSKGTYIRSIANDLGEALGVGGHLVKLIRVKAGEFKINSTIALDGLDKDIVKANLLSPLEMLKLSRKEISESELNLVKNGMKVLAEGFNDGEIVLLVKDKTLVSVAQFADGYLIQKKVFLN